MNAPTTTPGLTTTEGEAPPEAPAFRPLSERNLRLLAVMDASGNDSKPEEQMGILCMGLVLASRRLLKEHNVTDRGRRHHVLKKLVEDIDSRLRKYADPSRVIAEEHQLEAMRQADTGEPPPETHRLAAGFADK